jgi:hypothetical protein
VDSRYARNTYLCAPYISVSAFELVHMLCCLHISVGRIKHSYICMEIAGDQHTTMEPEKRQLVIVEKHQAEDSGRMGDARTGPLAKKAKVQEVMVVQEEFECAICYELILDPVVGEWLVMHAATVCFAHTVQSPRWHVLAEAYV